MSCPDYYGVSECELAVKVLQGTGARERERLVLNAAPAGRNRSGQGIPMVGGAGAKSAIILLSDYKAKNGLVVYTAQSPIEVSVSSQIPEFDPHN